MLPRRIEAADLSWPAFLRACELMVEIRAREPGLSHWRLCTKALWQAYREVDAPAAGAGVDQARKRVPAQAA
ncbi:MAG: hypothetical protein FJW34_19065 [Acidobacteria bacterium]|nr:hypothetical protein [Acidobacteriota bacterium]